MRTPNLYEGVVSPTRYGSDDTTYIRAGLYLSGPGFVEDWGCGTTYARRFIGAPYWGVDGCVSKFNNEQADLAVARPPVPKILMRHVLEHNWNWPASSCSYDQERSTETLAAPTCPTQASGLALSSVRLTSTRSLPPTLKCRSATKT
jgi:hypothetical protein